MFGILLFVSFLVGIPLGIVTSRFVRAKKNLPTILIFTPFLVLLFFSDIPIVDDMRYMFLCLAIGILCAWSYFDTKTKKDND